MTSPATARFAATDGGGTLWLAGGLRIAGLEALRRSLPELPGHGSLTIDLSEVSALDTAGAWLVVDLKTRLEAQGLRCAVTGLSDRQSGLMEAVIDAMPDAPPPPAGRGGLAGMLERLGRGTVAGLREFVEMLSFAGEFVARTVEVLVKPWTLRGFALVSHMQAVGLAAVPIVALMAFLVGVVLAYQGAAQLRQFGAEVFVVDLIAISVLRELGILLTAIIVAGRSASAFTAAIGSMKMREEIDAMRTLGLDPMKVLVVPRVLALMLTLPILGFIADVVGLIGGAVMSWIELGVSPGVFRARLIDSVDVSNYLVGLVKAPFFAVIIGLIGCFQGMKVEGNAESLGRLTSKSVVLAIFMVIVVDAMFSIFFAVLGV